MTIKLGRIYRKNIKMKKSIKIALITSGVIVLTLGVVYFVSIPIITEGIFARLFAGVSKTDYTLEPGINDFNRIDNEKYPSTQFLFPSGENQLKAYYFNNENSDDLIIYTPGVGSGADWHLAILTYLYDAGYDVISFDPTGIYDTASYGQQGFTQRLKDLNTLIDYINGTSSFSYDKLFLMGHSLGAFSSIIASNENENISGVVALAPLNQIHEYVYNSSSYYVSSGVFALTSWYVDAYLNTRYGEYDKMRCSDVINQTNLPYFIGHGDADDIIFYDSDSVNSKMDEITSNNVTFYEGKGIYSGHSTFMYSSRANIYREGVEEEIENASSDEEKRELISHVDHALYNEVNDDLFGKIIGFLRSI